MKHKLKLMTKIYFLGKKLDTAAVLVRLKFLQRALDDDEFQEHCRLLKGAVPKFLFEYFESNWLSPKWLSAWQDRGRPGEREGIYNTNNGVEALFRKLAVRFCHHKTSSSPSTAVHLLTAFLQHYDITWAQKEKGLVKLPTTQSKARLGRRIEAAEKILEERGTEVALSTCGSLYHIGEYVVNISTWACSCMFFVHSGKICKHAIAARFRHGLPAPTIATDLVPEGTILSNNKNKNNY